MADDLRMEAVRWVWPGRIAEGKITLLAGDPGVGKSMIALDVAARLSRGRGFPELVTEGMARMERSLLEREALAAQREAENLRVYGTRVDPFGDVRTGVVKDERRETKDEMGASGTGGQVVEGVVREEASQGGGKIVDNGKLIVDRSAGLRKVRMVGEGIKGKTLIFSAEDDWRDTVMPRLKAMGADMAMVDEYRSLDSYIPLWMSFSVRNDLEDLARHIRAEKDVKLLILDPITACMEGIDQNSTAAVRQHLAPLAHLMARLGVAVLGITHLNKRRRTVDIYRTTGSLAVAAMARAVHFAMPGVDGGPCTLTAMKSNLSAGAEALAYRIHENTVEWLGEPFDGAQGGESEEEEFRKLDVETAKEFLAESLAGGALPGEPLIRQAKRLAISERTLRRAKAAMRVKSKKDGLGEWYWLLEGQSLI